MVEWNLQTGATGFATAVVPNIQQFSQKSSTRCGGRAGNTRPKHSTACRAEAITDPEQRADMIRLAQMWMSLSEPLPDIPVAYEWPPQGSDFSRR